MTNSYFGILFERKNINYNRKKLEIFEIIDYVCGLQFINTYDKSNFAVFTGEYAENVFNVLNHKNIKDKSEKYFILLQDIEDAIKANENRVEFQKIRNNFLTKAAKYYYYSKNRFNEDDNKMKAITDKNLLEYLDILYDNENNDKNNLPDQVNIKDMYENIKKTIISQDEQIIQILTTIYKNQKVVNSNLDENIISKLKENILVCGPTGTGKTEILKRISNLYNIPIVIEDATTLSETGYVGRDVIDMLRDLYIAAGEDLNKAEKGILVIDEFDKLAEIIGSGEALVSRVGVQRSLLKLLDGSIYYFNKDGKSDSKINNLKFDTSKLTIVCLGAFSNIKNITNYNMMGFSNSDISKKCFDYKNLKMQDFVKYGIMQELMGRFSKIVYMNSLSVDDIKKIILYSDFSPLNIYKKLFEELNIEFEYDDKFINWVVDQAMSLNSGARSLKTIFDECISSALFKIFAGDCSKIEMISPTNENNKSYVLTKK